MLTLTGSLVVTALHLPAGVLRWAGLIVLFLAGLGLVVPAVQRVLQHPFTRLPQPDPSRAGGPFVLGLALGAVYVPCAGPVIAAIAIAGATGQVDQGVLVLTAAFSIGTAVPLLLFAYAGKHFGGRGAGQDLTRAEMIRTLLSAGYRESSATGRMSSSHPLFRRIGPDRYRLVGDG